MIEEPVRVLFHLNGYTKVLVERTEGLGYADGGITWEIPTEDIPAQLRKIGSRFIVSAPTKPEEMSNGYRIRPLGDAGT